MQIRPHDEEILCGIYREFRVRSTESMSAIGRVGLQKVDIQCVECRMSVKVLSMEKVSDYQNATLKLPLLDVSAVSKRYRPSVKIKLLPGVLLLLESSQTLRHGKATLLGTIYVASSCQFESVLYMRILINGVTELLAYL